MLTGCIQEKEPPSWLDFHVLLATVDLDDSIGHLFIVDIFFDEKKYYWKAIALQWNFSTNHWKQKTLDANERSAYQFLDLFDKNKDKPNHIVVLLNLMPLCFQKALFHSIWKIWDFWLKDAVGK